MFSAWAIRIHSARSVPASRGAADPIVCQSGKKNPKSSTQSKGVIIDIASYWRYVSLTTYWSAWLDDVLKRLSQLYIPSERSISEIFPGKNVRTPGHANERLSFWGACPNLRPAVHLSDDKQGVNVLRLARGPLKFTHQLGYIRKGKKIMYLTYGETSGPCWLRMRLIKMPA